MTRREQNVSVSLAMRQDERVQRFQFLALTDRDVELLRALRPLLEKEAPAVIDAFYDHLLQFEEPRQLLSDRTTVQRLKRILCQYLLRITEGNFDQAYFQDRLRIGQTHERVGLEPRWYLMGYSFYYSLFAPRVRQHYAQDPDRASDSLVALEKIFMLDASLAIEAYIGSDRYRRLQLLEGIFSHSADAIFTLCTEKRIRAWNRGAERMFGWREDEILGKHVRLLIPPERLGELKDIDRALAEKGFCHMETVRLAKDGRRLDVSLTLSLMRNAQGDPIGRSVIVRDVTEQRRLEERQQQAERLALIGTMSAKLAHEIRNPLSTVVINMHLLQKTMAAQLDADKKSLLDVMAVELRRVQGIVEDYLKFARLPRLRPAPLSLNTLIEQRVPLLQSSLGNSKVKLEIRLASDLPLIHADQEQLWQAMLNLARNAVEAMPDGGTLTIQTATDGGFVLLRVSDTGKGISEEARDRIFQPFFSTKSTGTGLGLALVQQIILEHGGDIECSSQPNRGSTFTLRLPLLNQNNKD